MTALHGAHFVERRDAVVRAVSGDAHCPNAAEKPIELVRPELKSIWREYGDLPFSAALRVATMHMELKRPKHVQTIS